MCVLKTDCAACTKLVRNGAPLRSGAGPIGSDIGCLMTPNATNVQQITPNISNLHFHANSEHTRDGAALAPCLASLQVHCLHRPNDL